MKMKRTQKLSMLITFSRPTFKGAGCLHTAPPPTRRRTPCPPGLSIGALNIRYGRGCGLAQATREVERGGLDLMSLTETIQTKACSKNWRGYDIMCAAARPSRASGAKGGKGVGIARLSQRVGE